MKGYTLKSNQLFTWVWQLCWGENCRLVILFLSYLSAHYSYARIISESIEGYYNRLRETEAGILPKLVKLTDSNYSLSMSFEDYLSSGELARMRFKHLGEGVKVSRRSSLYGCENISIGNYSRIDDYTVISVGKKGDLRLGNHVHFSTNCSLTVGNSNVTIGDFFTTAANCHLYGVSDDYSGESLTNGTVESQYRKLLTNGLQIGNYCILGVGVSVLPGVTLPIGTAIGAHSLVTKSTLPWSINVGTPSKYVKRRSDKLLQMVQEMDG